MVIHDLHIVGVAVLPAKADAPLIIDANAVLSLSIPSQRLRPVARRCPKVLKRARVVDLEQFAVCRLDDVVGKAFDEAALPSSFGG
jgi:hypothetical protein